MGFQGYFIKIGEYTIPLNCMNPGSYNACKSTIELDAYMDADGVSHRDILEHTPCKVEFETPQMMMGTKFSDLMSNIKDNYINAQERKVEATVFIPEENDYITQEMYLQDFTPSIAMIINGEIRYNPICLAFIGY